jgi:hypothetical protein
MKGNWLQRWLISWLEQCFMRRAPQDDAASPAMLQVAVVAYLGVDLLQALPGADWTVAVGMGLVDTLFMVLFCWLLLRVTNRPARFVQTLTALAGTGAVLGVAGLPMIWQAGRAPAGDTPGAMLVLGWLLLLVWSVAVKAHIFRHALSSPYAAGVLVAILHTLLAITLLSYWFPHAAG